MKKYIKYLSIVICAGVLLTSAGLIFAQDRTEQFTKIKNLQLKALENAKDKIVKLQGKVSQIKDNTKKGLAQGIISQLYRVNQIWTDHFTNVLDQLDAVLVKMQTRTDKAAAAGKDVTAVNTAITAAKSAIQTARTAVEAQAQKIYTVDATLINLTSSVSITNGQNQLLKGLRDQFKAQKEQLKEDLMNLRDGVMKDARMAVQNIVPALSAIPDINN